MDYEIANNVGSYFLVVHPNGSLQWWDLMKNKWYAEEFTFSEELIKYWGDKINNNIVGITWYFNEPMIFERNPYAIQNN